MAVDLREIIGAIRISSDLERIGDMAKTLLKGQLPFQKYVSPPPFIMGLKQLQL